MRAVILLCLGLALAQAMCPPKTSSDNHSIIKRPPIKKDPHVYISGLLGLHDHGKGLSCGDVQPTGIQNLMAFMYGIDVAASKVESEFGLGGIVFDTCKSGGHAVQEIMNFETCTVGHGNPVVLPSNTVAYVGPETIWLYDTAPITAGFKKTQIAFSSTHPMFSDKEKFPFVARTVPSDVPHVHALVSVAKTMKYQSVQFVYVDTGMGRSAKDLFEKAAGEAGLCVEQYVHVPEDVDESKDYDDAVDHLMKRATVKAVVLWFDKRENDQDKSQARAFIEAVNRRNAQGIFYWIATDAWGQRLKVDALIYAAEGATIVSPSSSTSDFATHFRSLKPTTDKPAIFRKWWMDKFHCDLPGLTAKHNQPCNLTTQSLASEVVNPRATFIIDAVQAVVDGIRKTNDDNCANLGPICSNFPNDTDHFPVLRDNIMHSTLLNDKTGDRREARYDIYNLRRSANNKLQYIKVGTYIQVDQNEPQLTLDVDGVHLYDARGVRVIKGLSECKPGYCSQCAVATAAPTTVQPGEETGPFKMFRMKGWMIALVVLAGLGLFITICFEIYILSKLIGTKSVKQFRTMWLGQLLLVGIFMSYLLLFAFVPSPTYFTCGLIRFGVGSCYAIMFSVLLVKLMIILSSESIGYLKGVYQVLMFMFAWAVQIVIDAEWLILVPPTASWNADKMGWQCDDAYLGHIQSLVYVMFLILICTIIAARTHGIITNHREGIFIGLAAGFSIPIWIAWTLVGSLNENTDFQEPTIAYGLLINTTLILFTMFLPKVRQLNTMGMEGIYLEDDGNDNDAYGSVIYGPPSYQSRPGSVYQVNGVNGAPLLTKDGSGQPLQLVPQQQVLYDQLSHPHYVRNTAGSVRSVPAYATAHRNSKTLKVSGDLTGRLPFDKRGATSEIAYKSRSSYHGSVKRSGSVTDLGAL